MAQHVELRAQRRFAWSAVAASIPFPASKHVGICREHQGFEASGLGTPHDVFGDRSLAHDIQLHPQSATGACGDVFEARRGNGAQAKWDAEIGRGTGECDVAIRVEHAVHAGRGDDERRGRRAAEQLDLVIAGGRVDEGLRDETQLLECPAIAAQRLLILGATLHVLENEVRNTPARDLTQIRDVQYTAQVASAELATLPRHDAGPAAPRIARD